MLTLACEKEHSFQEDLLVVASYRRTPVLEFLFNSEYCEIFKSTYFEEHLHTAVSENVFMKLRKVKIFKGNTQFVQKVTFKPLMDFKQNYYGSWKYYKCCYFLKFSSPKL